MFLIFLRVLCVLSGLIFIQGTTEARVDTGADFLKFITGARVTGLAGAYVGLADDVSSLHYNPAGLCNIEKNELLLMESEAIMECGYEYFGYARRIGEDTGIGFAILYFHAPRMDRLDDYGGVVGEVEYYDLMANLSIGTRIRDKLSFGCTMKEIIRTISPDKGYTGAIDVGFLYTHKDNMKLGLSVQNIGPDIWGDQIPRLAQIGTSYKIESLIISSAISHQLLPNSSFEYRVGGEYWYWKGLCLRAGYYAIEGDLKGATLGAGLRLKNWLQLDFAQFPANIDKPLQGSMLIRF